VADRRGLTRPLTYDPAADAAERYPDWVIRTADLGGVIPEVMSRSRRVILIEGRQNAAVRRCSLAHAIAHLDLGHHETLAGWFENREEADADDLAARRLITLEELGRALAWTRVRHEVAAELDVDLTMLAVREQGLDSSERRRLRRMLARDALVV
jgi:hypothetical protein